MKRTIAAEWIFTGKHTGPLGPPVFEERLEPTGRTIQFRGVTIYDVRNSLIQRPVADFQKIARILSKGDLFAFVVGDRGECEAHAFRGGPEHSKSESPVMTYRHTSQQIDAWLKRYGFKLVRSRAFTAFTDRERTRSMPIKAYLARKV